MSLAEYIRCLLIRDRLRFGRDGSFLLVAQLGDLNSERLGCYYINSRRAVTALEQWEGNRLDEAGIPRTRRGGDIYYFPIVIAQYALGQYELYLDSGQETNRTAFLKQADWLVEHLGSAGDSEGVWTMPFANPSFGASGPWRSAMAQGQGISVLLRAFQETGQSQYMQAASKALLPFTRSIDESGVTWWGPGGKCVFEEVAVQPPSHILNGHIFAMFGLWDMVRVASDRMAGTLFRQGLETIVELLPCYDTGSWSCYELRTSKEAPLRYHMLHIEQLRVLAALTGDMRLVQTADRWDAYSRRLGPVARSLARERFECGASRAIWITRRLRGR